MAYQNFSELPSPAVFDRSGDIVPSMDYLSPIGRPFEHTVHGPDESLIDGVPGMAAFVSEQYVEGFIKVVRGEIDHYAAFFDFDPHNDESRRFQGETEALFLSNLAKSGCIITNPLTNINPIDAASNPNSLIEPATTTAEQSTAPEDPLVVGKIEDVAILGLVKHKTVRCYKVQDPDKAYAPAISHLYWAKRP